MKKLVSLVVLVCAIVGQFTPTSAYAQGSIQVFMAVGPDSGESGYQKFLGDMMQGMKTTSQVDFLRPGAELDAKSIVSFPYGNRGSGLYMGFSVKNLSFTLDQISRSVGDSIFKSTNPLTVARTFGLSLNGERPSGEAYAYGDLVDGAPLSQVWMITDFFSIGAANNADVERAIEGYRSIHGNAVEYTAQYSLGSMSGQSSVTIVPEPSTLTLLFLSSICLIRLNQSAKRI